MGYRYHKLSHATWDRLIAFVDWLINVLAHLTRFFASEEKVDEGQSKLKFKHGPKESLSKLDPILRKIEDNDPSLSLLDLACYFARLYDEKEEGFIKLSYSLRHNSSVKTAWFTGNRIEDDAVTVFADCLPTTALTHLYLNGNSVSHRASLAIGKAISSKTIRVQRLDLMYNYVCDAGAIGIAEGLRENTSILYLNLWGNKIGDQGASAIANALFKNTTLRALNLNSNKGIGDVGACAFGEMLANSKTALQELNLNCCNIGNRGFAALGKGLSTNKSLLNLNISTNLIDDEGAVLFAQNIKDNSTFRKLVFDDSNIQDKGAQQMLRAKFYVTSPTGMLRGNNLSRDNRSSIYYSWKACAGMKCDRTNRYPLHIAADQNLKWRRGLKMILEANYAPLIQPDDQTSLYPFMLSAVGERADLEATYRLLRSNPEPMGYC